MTQTEKTYYRASLGLKKEIAGAVADDYQSALIAGIRRNEGRLELPRHALSFTLAQEFGFCYGVDKAVDMAYEARAKFPDRRIFLLTEIIHNPRVNKRLIDMGIVFLSGQYSGTLTEDDITPEDVVLVPAFGTDTATFRRLRELGCILVDTTCGSVVHVWKRVERYARDGFTSLVHGKHYHEETIATVSQATPHGGHYLVVRGHEETDRVIACIEGRLDGAALLEGFDPHAYSEGFDPERHLQRIGVANQTTMLASESLAIARRIGEALANRHGEEGLAERFRSFDTICSATQDRQDAVHAMMRDEAARPDLMLVVGGYNSSNTGHLRAVAEEYCPAFHIQDAQELLSADRIRHLPAGAKEPQERTDWLPEGSVRIGLTAGASTPNRALADTVARVLELRGIAIDEALEALPASSED